MDGHPFLLSLRCTSWPSFGPNLGLEPWRIRVKVSAPCALPCGGIFARTCESFRCCRVVAFHFRIEIISESEFCTSSLIYRYQCTCRFHTQRFGDLQIDPTLTAVNLPALFVAVCCGVGLAAGMSMTLSTGCNHYWWLAPRSRQHVCPRHNQ